MSTPAPLQAEALDLLNKDLYLHLDGANSLATQYDEWTDEDIDAARKVIVDLVLVIRSLLVEHERQTSGNCQICGSVWPCPVVTTIHSFLKDPHHQFVALIKRTRE